MFFEILAIGIFVAAAVLNIEPPSNVGNVTRTNNGVTDIYSAPEDWVATLRSSQMAFYANPGSVRKNRYKAKMWRLTDYHVAQINGDFVYLSKKSQEEYDCDIGQVRLLFTALYAEHMGTGETVYSHAETFAWEPVMLDTDTATMWKIACGRQ